MTATSAAPNEPALLFNWGPPRRRARALVIFICLSFLVHALAFYIFQVIYPPAAILLPPPARVKFIANDTEPSRALLRWIDAEDPALTSATLRPPDSRARALPKIAHIPSYMEARLQLKDPPPIAMDLRPPSALPPAPPPMPRDAVTATPHHAPTRVIFSEEISTLGDAQLAPSSFRPATREQPESVRFRIAVNSRGIVQYIFAINSSGDAGLDAQARQQLSLARFPVRPDTDGATLTWGIATFDWGNDLAFPAPPANAPAPTETAADTASETGP